jgi:uncharacterized protein (TIGR03067 family)
MKNLITVALVGLMLMPIANGEESPKRPSDLEARIAALEAEIGRLQREVQQLKGAQTADRLTDAITVRLNGRWRYILAVDDEGETSYEESGQELVIDGSRWTVLAGGVPALEQTVQYDFSQSPATFLRKAPRWAPGHIARGILEFRGDRLVYTTTALEDPSPSYEQSEPAGPAVPKSFEPKGTENTTYTLKRISDSVKVPSHGTAHRREGEAGQ